MLIAAKGVVPADMTTLWPYKAMVPSGRTRAVQANPAPLMAAAMAVRIVASVVVLEEESNEIGVSPAVGVVEPAASMNSKMALLFNPSVIWKVVPSRLLITGKWAESILAITG